MAKNLDLRVRVTLENGQLKTGLKDTLASIAGFTDKASQVGELASAFTKLTTVIPVVTQAVGKLNSAFLYGKTATSYMTSGTMALSVSLSGASSAMDSNRTALTSLNSAYKAAADSAKSVGTAVSDVAAKTSQSASRIDKSAASFRGIAKEAGAAKAALDLYLGSVSRLSSTQSSQGIDAAVSSFNKIVIAAPIVTKAIGKINAGFASGASVYAGVARSMIALSSGYAGVSSAMDSNRAALAKLNSAYKLSADSANTIAKAVADVATKVSQSASKIDKGASSFRGIAKEAGAAKAALDLYSSSVAKLSGTQALQGIEAASASFSKLALVAPVVTKSIGKINAAFISGSNTYSRMASAIIALSTGYAGASSAMDSNRAAVTSLNSAYKAASDSAKSVGTAIAGVAAKTSQASKSIDKSASSFRGIAKEAGAAVAAINLYLAAAGKIASAVPKQDISALGTALGTVSNSNKALAKSATSGAKALQEVAKAAASAKSPIDAAATSIDKLSKFSDAAASRLNAAAAAIVRFNRSVSGSETSTNALSKALAQMAKNSNGASVSIDSTASSLRRARLETMDFGRVSSQSMRDLSAALTSVSASLKLLNTSSLKGVSSSLAEATRNAQAFGAQSQQSMTSTSNAIQSLKNQLAGFFAARQLLQTTNAIIGQADAWQLLEAKLSAALGGQSKARDAMDDLYKVAQATMTPIEALGNLYSRLGASAQRLGVDQQQLSVFTKLVSQSLKLSGASAGEAASVLRQLSQAMASGVLRGDEFNSVMENGFYLADTLAKQLGVTTGSLRAMAEAGTLTADKVFNALLAGADDIDKAFNDLPVTVGYAMSQVGNAWERYIGQTNQGIGATKALSSALQAVASNIEPIIGATLITGMAAVGVGMAKLTQASVARVSAMRAEAAEQKLKTANAVALAENELAAARKSYYGQQQLRTQAIATVTQELNAKRNLLLIEADNAVAQQRVAQTMVNAAGSTQSRVYWEIQLSAAIAGAANAEAALAANSRALAAARLGVTSATAGLSGAELKLQKERAISAIAEQRRIIAAQRAIIEESKATAATLQNGALIDAEMKKQAEARWQVELATGRLRKAELLLAETRLALGVSTDRLSAAQARYTAATTAAAGATTLLGRATNFLLGPWGIALTLLGTFAYSFAESKKSTEAAANSLEAYGGSVEKAIQSISDLEDAQATTERSVINATNALNNARTAYDGTAASALRLRQAEDDLAKAQQANAVATANAQKALNATVAEAAKSANAARDAAKAQGAEVNKLTTQLERLRSQLALGEISSQKFEQAQRQLENAKLDLVIADGKLSEAEDNLGKLMLLQRDRAEGLAQQQRRTAETYTSTSVAVGKAVTALDQYAKMQSDLSKLEGERINQEIAVAKARGENVRIAELQTQAAETEARAAQVSLAVKQSEVNTLQLLVDKIRAYAAAKESLTPVEAEEFQKKQRQLELAQAELTAIESLVKAKQSEIDISKSKLAAIDETIKEQDREWKSQQNITQSAIDRIKAERDLLVIKGRTTEASRLSQQIAVLEIQKLEQESFARRDAAAAARDKIKIILQEEQALGQLSPEKQRMLEQLQNEQAENEYLVFTLKEQIALRKEEEKAVLSGYDSIKALGDQLEKERLAREASTNATRGHAQASEENTEALDSQAEAMRGVAAVASNFASLLDNTRQQMLDLSENALAMFNEKFNSLAGVYGTTAAAARGFKNEIDGLQQQIANDAWVADAAETAKLFGDSFVDFEANVAIAAAETRMEYNKQLIALENLKSRLEDFGGSGSLAIDAIKQATRAVNDELYLLNDTDLSRLNNALDDANARLERMRELSQTAKDRLTELDAQIAEAQGDREKAELLRQELEYQRQLSELDAQRAEAQASGNRELLRLLDEQEAKLRKLNELKEHNIKADSKEKSSNSSSGGGGSGGKGGVYRDASGGISSGNGDTIINISAPNAGIIDPSFVDKLMPEIKKNMSNSARRLR